jgi:uncharacterized protein YkwD
MLTAHNAIRAPLKLRPLTWSDKLAERARDWAETLLARDKFVHRPNSEYGENLFTMTGGGASVEQVVQAWASESRDYDYRSNQCRKKCGHYTQIVWRQTRKVGCAVARNPHREVWVCNYEPPGNYVGQRPY